MKVKELIEALKEVNPEAKVVIQDKFDWAEGELLVVEIDPTTEKESSSLVKLIGDFN